MSKYTTGEIAKLCGVSVRTVQYYDTRGILVPSELTEGGRRLYSEEDLKRMRIVCFLRDAGISINSIGELLSEENPAEVILILLKQQEELLQKEMKERQTRLNMLAGIRREIKSVENFSVEAIGDMAYVMENKRKMRQLHAVLLAAGIPMNIFQLSAIILWIVGGMWQFFAAYVLVMIPYGIWITHFYFKRVVYICPHCHQVFKPCFREAFWAKHTPRLRKLTCTSCGYKGYCVETYGKEETANE